jgi:hypothetical protein
LKTASFAVKRLNYACFIVMERRGTCGNARERFRGKMQKFLLNHLSDFTAGNSGADFSFLKCC